MGNPLRAPRLYFQVLFSRAVCYHPPMSNNTASPWGRWERVKKWVVERRVKVKDAAVNIRRAFGVVWEAHPPSALAMGACTVVGALLPASQAWVGKLFVDAGVNGINTRAGAEPGLRAVLPLLLAEFVLLVIQATNGQARSFAEHVLHARINLSINTRIIRKALELDLSHFENPEYYDKLQNARREADWRSLMIVNNGFYVIQNAVTLLSYGALLPRYADLFWKFLREDQAIAQKRSLASLGWGLLATLSYYGAYAWIVWRAVGGVITLGDMTMYLAIFRGSQNMFEAIFYGLSDLYENGLFMSNLFAFLELEPQMAVAARPLPAPRNIRQGIEFRNVWFKYDGHGEWALRDVSLCIQPGEKIALVGPNGAGKTTLIKLLTRLYDPTEGEILLDGVDLRDYDLHDLRQRVGVIFQDFVRYHVSAAENVGFGQIEALDDRPRIVGAARKSGADPVITALPDGYDTVLGRWWNKGRELSGGEWQKIALARAFMRDCEGIVLDEPTASLDAENEFRVFQQFRALTSDKMAVLISHRFSTGRMADQIYVIEKGEITEQGAHADLLALGGTYARLFTLQAESYK